MSSESLPAKKPRARVLARIAPLGEPPRESSGLLIFDAFLIAGFLTLAFILGLFPLKDTDFWWHLRTGDLIRQSGRIPTHDLYTYTSQSRPWVDLHWTFQVAISWLYQRGGVPALTIAKSVITCIALFLLITARRREWPVWAVLLGWLPALLVLCGRNYVRPETFTLFYLSCFLAILVRIDRMPLLAFLLPFIQVCWVNAQGLFVLGPLLLACALIDTALRPGAFAPGRSKWWRRMGLLTILTALACLINPYGLTGALYPLQIARTMGNPVFSNSIAELTPIPVFIQRDGLISLPLRLHLLTMAIGALSFVAPIIWYVFTRYSPLQIAISPSDDGDGKVEKGKKSARKRERKSVKPASSPIWRLSIFRLLLFFVFSVLSLQATRNSHQFAAVVGALTAWNLAEWIAAIRLRGWLKHSEVPEPPRVVYPRVATLLALGGLCLWVLSGGFYAAAGEGRTIGTGEQPLWFPHEAVKFSATRGMPNKFLAFHIGHASLYDYYFGPDRKSYVDARLEVIGTDLFEKYMNLQRSISNQTQGWSGELKAIGLPSVLADHEMNFSIGAAMLTSSDWRCVWFDPVAAVFVHASYTDVVDSHSVDFASRHFHPDPDTSASGMGSNALLASAKGLRNLAGLVLRSSPEKARPLILLGRNYAERSQWLDPQAPDGWKLLGQFETLREPPPQIPIARFRQPFDPVFDLSSIRATFAFRKALEAAPNDFMTLMLLSEMYRSRGLNEAAIPLMERLALVAPINQKQAETQQEFKVMAATLRAGMGSMPPLRWENLSDLGQLVNQLLASGRAETAANCLEKATTSEVRTWEDADRIATWRLHLGQTGAARLIWEGASKPPSEAMRSARIAASYFVEGDFDKSGEVYRTAVAADPGLFEALYALAVLEQDAGRAGEALVAARRAEKAAMTDVARSAIRTIITTVTPYATSPIAR